ncbi:hypothetical protein J7K56_00755 [Candidatus Calescamantes bacterium]|nr:hypothetical protein [Candidatus Calescamantes bacterium]
MKKDIFLPLLLILSFSLLADVSLVRKIKLPCLQFEKFFFNWREKLKGGISKWDFCVFL